MNLLTIFLRVSLDDAGSFQLNDESYESWRYHGGIVRGIVRGILGEVNSIQILDILGHTKALGTDEFLCQVS